MKKTVRITESDLSKIVTRTINEMFDQYDLDWSSDDDFDPDTLLGKVLSANNYDDPREEEYYEILRDTFGKAQSKYIREVFSGNSDSCFNRARWGEVMIGVDDLNEPEAVEMKNIAKTLKNSGKFEVKFMSEPRQSKEELYSKFFITVKYYPIGLYDTESDELDEAITRAIRKYLR